MPATNRETEMVRNLCAYIQANLEGPVTLAALGAHARMSPHHLQRTFKRLVGITPREYADALRLDRFKSGLKEGQAVTTALYDAGYGSSSRLYERAPSQLGMTPSTYRRGGVGLRIAYTVADCSLGRVLVAGTGRGLCAVYLGDSDARLEKALAEEYPRAELRRDRNGLTEWVRALVSHLAGEERRLNLPLDVQATAFQRRVWQQLQAIPYGATRTYSQIARQLGRPKAARAVARACATNPVSVVIPCHRVVREDGSLGGYRWGLDRKRRLLDQEHGLLPHLLQPEK
jgi:AraC family transcriptional regulator of adaptative response/methylated-DNA-[protein]-cysteine methyltransferase